MFFSILPVNDQNSITTEFIHPVAEVVDLLINGSIPILINVTRDFLFITVLIWTMDFVANTFKFTDFAAGNPLANGIQVLHEGTSILGNGAITTNEKFAHTSFDLQILTDEAGVKNRILLARWNIVNAVPPDGIRFVNNQSFQFLIEDDLTAVGLAITDFTVTIAGFRIETVIEKTSSITDWEQFSGIILWWALALQQNIFLVLATGGIMIIVIKILRGT